MGNTKHNYRIGSDVKEQVLKRNKEPCSLLQGSLLAFGARLAGGCTSGHGISGTLQLNVASWIAVICFFIGGIAVAMLLFKL